MSFVDKEWYSFHPCIWTCNLVIGGCIAMLVGALSGRLGMSKEAVKQRLIEMGLLIVEDNVCGYWDNAGAVSVGEVLRRIFS